jgi:hypothetical protein
MGFYVHPVNQSVVSRPPTTRPTEASMTSRTPGLVIEDHGTICLLRPRSKDIARRLRNLVGEQVIWFGGALACEPRYVSDVVDALANGEGETPFC